MKRNRREMIELSSDDETAGQPSGRNAKRQQSEEPAPSPEVAELRQKVTKLQTDFQGACRHARRFEMRLDESQKRVQFLEDIIEKKPAKPDVPDKKLVEDLQEKLADISTHLDETRKEAANREAQLLNRLADASTQLDETKKYASSKEVQLLKRLADVSTKLDDTRKYAAREKAQLLERFYDVSTKLDDTRKDAASEKAQLLERVDELKGKLAWSEREYAHLRKELKEANEDRRKADILSSKLDETRKDAASKEAQLLKRIFILTKQPDVAAAARGHKKEQPKQPQRPSLLAVPIAKPYDPSCTVEQADSGAQEGWLSAFNRPRNAFRQAANAVAASTEKPADKDFEDAKNILRNYPAGAPDTIAFDYAQVQLLAAFSAGAKDERWIAGRKAMLLDEELSCTACDKPRLRGSEIFPHLFSSKHTKKAADKAVSRVAFEYWMRKFDSIQPPPSPSAPKREPHSSDSGLEARRQPAAVSGTPRGAAKYATPILFVPPTVAHLSTVAAAATVLKQVRKEALPPTVGAPSTVLKQPIVTVDRRNGENRSQM